jgi:hypothetical protein
MLCPSQPCCVCLLCRRRISNLVRTKLLEEEGKTGAGAGAGAGGGKAKDGSKEEKGKGDKGKGTGKSKEKSKAKLASAKAGISAQLFRSAGQHLRNSDLRACLARLGVNLTEGVRAVLPVGGASRQRRRCCGWLYLQETATLMSFLDADRSGFVTVDEFQQWLTCELDAVAIADDEDSKTVAER